MKHHTQIAEIQDHMVKLTHSYNEALKQSPVYTEEQKNYVSIVDNMDIASSMTSVAYGF